jgi:hypothetical protein
MPTLTPTFTETPSVTPSFTPTQFLGFNDAYVYESWASFEGTNFYFIVPGVKANYYGLVDGYPMTCESDVDEENLLVCFSEENLFGTDIKAFEFFADEALTIPVYEGEFSTYLDQPAPTEVSSGLIWPRADYTSADVTWGNTPPGCSERGINFSCEIEYRLYFDGACLVGMSCFDSCGFYYSVDTIKHKEGDWISWGPCW